jgi:hypothetical protein
LHACGDGDEEPCLSSSAPLHDMCVRLRCCAVVSIL